MACMKKAQDMVLVGNGWKIQVGAFEDLDHL